MGAGLEQTSATTGGGSPSIIYAGRGYQTVTKPMPITVNGTTVTMATSVWECYDIRTGQVYWDQTGITQPPTSILYDPGLGNASAVPGESADLRGMSISLVSIGARFMKYDPFTGAATTNISTAPLTSGTFYNNYALSIQTINAATNQYRLINWTLLGTATTLQSRILSNISFPFSSMGNTVDINDSVGVF